MAFQARAGGDPIDRDVMNRPPRRSQQELFNREFIKLILFTGVLIAAVTSVCLP